MSYNKRRDFACKITDQQTMHFITRTVAQWAPEISVVQEEKLS